jgi:hypothetical protein
VIRHGQGSRHYVARRDFVRFAASKGTLHRDLVPLIGCSKGTLEKYFAQELKRTKAEANISVGARLYEMATGAIHRSQQH